MSDVEIKSRSELVTDAIRRIVTYTSRVTWFGVNSVAGAFAETLGAQTSMAYRLYKATVRRFSLRAAEGDVLTEVAAERGAQRRPGTRSRVLVVVEPHETDVTAITLGISAKIEVRSSTKFAANDSIRIVNRDGSLTERVTIASISTGTGPNGNDEITVATLVNTYDPENDPTRVILRHTVQAQTELTTEVGVPVVTTESITIGDLNPIIAGEGTALALLDKVWCEAKTKGAAGNIGARTVNGLAVADGNVRDVRNPERGFGGSDEEDDPDLRYRTAHQFQRRSRETEAWIEAICVEADHGVLRATQLEASETSTFRIGIIARNGGPLTERRRRAVEQFVQERVRSFVTVLVENVVLTSVEVEFQCRLEPDTTLREAWIAAGDQLAAYLDFRRWAWGEDADYIELLRRCRNAAGIRYIEESTFLPSANVPVGDDSLPVFVRLSVKDLDSGETINADLATSFESSLPITEL